MSSSSPSSSLSLSGGGGASSLPIETTASRLDRSAQRLNAPLSSSNPPTTESEGGPRASESVGINMSSPLHPDERDLKGGAEEELTEGLNEDVNGLEDSTLEPEVDDVPAATPANLLPSTRSRPIPLPPQQIRSQPPRRWRANSNDSSHHHLPTNGQALDLDDATVEVSDMILNVSLNRPNPITSSPAVNQSQASNSKYTSSSTVAVSTGGQSGVDPDPPSSVVNLQLTSIAHNWQATKMTIKDRLSFMFNNEVLADIHFIVGKDAAQQRIPAHRFVLSVGSAVFDAMFNSKLATKDVEITLPDVEPASFLALLRFIYSDEVQIGPETVMTTLYTAKKYAVPALEKHCVDFLKHNLSADNAFMLLTQARLFDEPQLATMCLETIDKCTPEALNAEGFIDIDVDTLSSVLDRDSLRVKEARLFTAVLKWSEAECLRQGLSVNPSNQRTVLGPLLQKVRFPLMTVEEFAQGPGQSGILTDHESVTLFLYFTVNPKPPVKFLDVPRCSMSGKEQTVCRFQQIECRWGYSGSSDKIRFIVDRRIFVVGFGLYGSIHNPTEYQTTIQIFHTGSGRLLGSNESSFLSDGTNSTFRVMFKEPIEILPNTNYTANAMLKGIDSHYGTKGMRKVCVDCPLGLRVTFQFSYSAGNNNGTSVEDGQIPEIIFYT
ncbi:BTB/POZ domain-containing protein 1-like isoform X2 [Tigriopus californicus]|uniref:BTB/POZ domain-containing protein 1-like isoform X2 n=1 Tax=Tigriopus californicus TaxID=6832 RepID=UPI0027DA3BFA|nr:BTB/POZ domain-containing protein 1-like isoform X2 [Tigriopus californicus]